jgi:hypothetical protein
MSGTGITDYAGEAGDTLVAGKRPSYFPAQNSRLKFRRISEGEDAVVPR